MPHQSKLVLFIIGAQFAGAGNCKIHTMGAFSGFNSCALNDYYL